MRVIKMLIKILLVMSVVVFSVVLYTKNFQVEKGLKVNLWDNIYNENNITFFYEDPESEKINENILKLESTFNIKEIMSSEDEEISKALKAVDILNNIVTKDDVADTGKNNGYDILMEIGDGKKVSEKDMAIIERDLLVSAGFKSRVGEFRKEKPQFQSQPSYYVIEYYSNEYNKWVMIDFKERVYLKEKDIPASSIEIIENDIGKFSYVGDGNMEEYHKNIAKFVSSYTLAIDNTVDYKRSNCFLTYRSIEDDIDLKKGKIFIEPTIYTTSKDMFIMSPKDTEQKVDERPYLILMKKPVKDIKDYTFVIGAFKDSSVINDYCIRINDGEMQKVSTIYYEVNLEIGKNIIELSIDGLEIISKIEIERIE